MAEIETPDETLPVEWVPREDLLPNEWNPNRMTDEKRQELVHSIRDNGWTQPIVVKGESDEIIDGEQRWHAAGDSRVRSNETLTPDGVPSGHVPVFRLGVDDTQARVATLQHNIDGETDSDSLGEIFADLDESGLFYDTAERFQIGETGIDRLIERAENDDETPEAFTEEPEPDDDDPAAFSESMQFQMTGDEYATVMTVLDEVGLDALCTWAIENNVHSQIRVDMRDLSDRPAVYDPDEEVIEYPDVDVERHLRSYLREDDPAEVISDE